jgi:cytochrome c553
VEGSCRYVEHTVTNSRQWVVHQPGCWTRRGTTSYCKNLLCVKCHKRQGTGTNSSDRVQLLVVVNKIKNLLEQVSDCKFLKMGWTS